MGPPYETQNHVGYRVKTKINPPLLTTEELALRWKVSVGHLRNLRSLGGGPPYVRVATRGVRYRLRQVEEWEAKR